MAEFENENDCLSAGFCFDSANEEEVDDALTQERKQKKREEVDRKLKKDLKNTKNAAQREMKFEADKVFVTKQFIKRVIEGLG